jgi:hypothetical protein
MPEFTEFRPAARQPPRGEAGQCLRTALNEAADSDGILRYAEGIAKKGDLGFWFRHAWNVNSDGEAVDHTWGPTGERYIGRIIDTRAKLQAVYDRREYHFEKDVPYVPDGELGIDCLSRRQEADFGLLHRAGNGDPDAKRLLTERARRE